MAYNNNNNRNYNGNNNRNNNSAKNYKTGRDGNRYAAKSGAKLLRAGRITKAGSEANNDCITGWNISKRRGFMTLSAFPFTPSGLEKSNKSLKKWCADNGKNYEAQSFIATSRKSGKQSERWLAKITFRDTGEQVLHKAFFVRNEGKLYIKDIDMVASVNAPNGGVFCNIYVKN